jgi:hypothetical protein
LSPTVIHALVTAKRPQWTLLTENGNTKKQEKQRKKYEKGQTENETQ